MQIELKIPQTPLSINNNVRRLCEKVGLFNPVYVDTVPESWALQQECFPNVERKVLESGGERIVGWQIWESPDGRLIEAEYHAVWRSKEGKLLDITPKDIPCDRILFLEDKSRPYMGRMRDNIRLALQEGRLTQDLITVSEAKFRFMNKGNRASQYGEMAFPRFHGHIAKHIVDFQIVPG